MGWQVGTTMHMRSLARVGAAVLIVTAALSACSSGSSKTSSKPSGVPTSLAELAARYVTKVPAHFIAQPDPVGDTGPSNLAKAIKDDGAASVMRSSR